MRCPTCGGENPHEARFCVSCGLPLGPQGELGPSTGRRTQGLVPRDLPGLLEETINVYTRNPWPFFLIFFVPQIPGLLLSLAPVPTPWAVVAVGLVALFVLYVLAGGASVCAVGQQYLQPTVEPGYCYRRAWFKVVSLAVANVAFALALFGAVVTIVGIPLFFYLLVVWFFFVECIMVERSGPMAALWRSRDLVRGSYWRVFKIGMTYTLLVVALGLVTLVLSGLFGALSAFLGSLVAAVLSAVAGPFFSIAKTLIYLDLRIRKEGYTTGDLARSLGI